MGLLDDSTLSIIDRRYIMNGSSRMRLAELEAKMSIEEMTDNVASRDPEALFRALEYAFSKFRRKVQLPAGARTKDLYGAHYGGTNAFKLIRVFETRFADTVSARGREFSLVEYVTNHVDAFCKLRHRGIIFRVGVLFRYMSKEHKIKGLRRAELA